MLFIQIANIINELVQLDPDIKYYHYGLPEDVNRNIPNNFDPTSDTGRKFPYVLQIPRQLTARAQQNGTQSLFETHTVELLFIDTYDYQAQQFVVQGNVESQGLFLSQRIAYENVSQIISSGKLLIEGKAQDIRGMIILPVFPVQFPCFLTGA